MILIQKGVNNAKKTLIKCGNETHCSTHVNHLVHNSCWLLSVGMVNEVNHSPHC